MRRFKNIFRGQMRRWALIGALAFFALQLVAPVALIPRHADAIFGMGDMSITIGDIPAAIRDAISKAVKTAKDIAFKNVLKNYVNALAYNYAVKLATGEKGQKPYFVGDPMKMLKDAGDAAAGDLLDSIASDWIGKSQCDGHPYQGCKTDSKCPPPVMICPQNLSLEECSSSLDAKKKCLAAGCYISIMETADEYKIFDEKMIKQPTDAKKPRLIKKDGAGECVSSFSLCDLGDPQDPSGNLQVKLTIMARKADYEYDKGTSYKGDCPITEILDNYYGYREGLQKHYNQLAKSLGVDTKDLVQVDPGTQYLIEFSKKFNPKASEYGAYMTIRDQVKLTKAVNEKATEFTQSLQGEFKAVTSKITGVVKTPAAFLRGAGTSLFGKSIDPYLTYTGSLVADAVGIFTNTLANKLLDRYLNGLDEATASSYAGGSNKFGASSPGVTAAKLRFKELKQTSYSEGGNVDILSGLSSCPNQNDPTPQTCVIDSRFSTAISQKMLVRDAVEQGLLDGNKPFGYDIAGNQPDYREGYPYRSLVILRKYRIIPVGWELAAKYIGQYARGNYTLNDIIGEYDNPKSPFYQLIDPNWVLKIPETYCAREGAGPQVTYQTAIRAEDTNRDEKVDTADAASTLIQRQEDYCADEKQCLKEDEKGSCSVWGYCMEEKAVWRFDATECKPWETSCTLLTRRSGDMVSYLTDTVNTNSCSIDTVGCQWYCREYNSTAKSWACDGLKPNDATDPVISLNANARTCNVSADGCSEFIRVKGDGANLLLNSSFESYEQNPLAVKDDAASELFTYWPILSSFCGLQSPAVSDSYSGSTALRTSMLPPCPGNPDWTGTPFEDGTYTAQIADVGASTNERTFTFSLYAKQAADDADCTSDTGSLSVWAYRQPDAVIGGGMFTNVMNVATSGQWTRYTGTITFPKITFRVAAGEPLILASIVRPLTDQCDVIIDDFQMEENTLTPYKEYEESTKTYFKKPPSYLNCTGNAVTDDPLCASYTLQCQETEVGCEEFTSKTTGRKITGIISPPGLCNAADPFSCDQCSAEFVGCQAYRELEIDRMPLRPVRDPVSFVSTTGMSCPASAVGCEEYTNLEDVAAGGEGKEYYSKIKVCVETSDPDTGAYYTWEGSDEFGYQLRRYNLKKSNLDNGPCTNVGAENDPALVALGEDWPACIDNLDVDGDGTADYPQQVCTAADMADNPDCTEFFDSLGNVYYRLRTRLIYVSDDCKSYKNSVDSTASCADGICTNSGLACVDANSDGAINDEDCRGSIYHIIPNQGVQCTASNAGCRAYKGNAGDNTRQVYREDFESGSIDLWSGDASYSNESLNLNGHSMAVTNSAAISNVGSQITLPGGQQYSVSLWVKSAVSGSDVPVTVAINSTPAMVFSGKAVAKTGEWNQFVLGPLYLPESADISANQLVIYGDSAFYVDNIEITEVYDSVYLIKDSYQDCSGWEGCDAYSDSAGTVHYLKSFRRLCDKSKVGCDIFIDTYNTEMYESMSYTTARYLRGDLNDDGRINRYDIDILNRYLSSGTSYAPVPLLVGDFDENGSVDATDRNNFQSYIGGGPEPSSLHYDINPSISQDTVGYYVYDSDKACGAGSKGCERMGLPLTNADGSVSAYGDSYMINDPDAYATEMCLYNENGCEEYTTGSGSQMYFKEPGKKTCSYQKDKGGWFKNGSASATPDCPVSIGTCYNGGANEGALCNSSDDCDSGNCLKDDRITPKPVDGWVGSCEESVSGCTEYRDPEGIADNAEVLSQNFLTNGSFESIDSVADAGIVTDAIIDNDTCNAGRCQQSGYPCAVDLDCYVPDEFLDWGNQSTKLGLCTAGGPQAGYACNSNIDCGRCDTDYTSGCGGGATYCDDNNDCVTCAGAACPGTCEAGGTTCNRAASTCDLPGPGEARQPCGDRLIATSDAHDGAVAAIFRSYQNCTNAPWNDAAHYQWRGIDTGSLTDNKTFRISFWAKRNPNDPRCTVLADPTYDGVSVGAVRTVDQVLPNGVQYLPGAFFHTTDSWQKYEYVISIPSTPFIDGDGVEHEWNPSGGTTLEELQNRFSVVFRRPGVAASTPVCDVILDQVQVEQVSAEADYASYYYLSDTIDSSSCNGLVSRDAGCRLFEDMSRSDLPYSSSASVDGEEPATCVDDPTTCDSNSVVKVRPDRECGKWLACETTVREEDKNGNVQELCTSRFICDKMDEATGVCTGVVDYEEVDQTFTSPAFAEKVHNYSGMVMAGLDWQRRCKNNKDIICTSDAQCGAGGTCSDPQIVEGALLYPAMEEAGSVTSGTDLAKNGDFGDGDYEANQKLSCELTGGATASCTTSSDYGGSPDAGPTVDEIDLSELDSAWQPRNWFDGVATVKWTEEDVNNGGVPSQNSNLDENNVARVKTSGYTGNDTNNDGTIGTAQWNGLSYDIGTGNLIDGDQYVVSLKLRWATLPTVYDKIRVEFGYLDARGNEIGWSAIEDVELTQDWQQFTLGPIEAGWDPIGGAEVTGWNDALLNIIHFHDEPQMCNANPNVPCNVDADCPVGDTCNIVTVPGVEFFVDDISIEPALKYKEDGSLIPRSCRLYPNASAPYCAYTDENGIEYRGWEGYCLERDPLNPAYCLNWWPADLLMGDTNIFSNLRTAGYDGRRPLYMCLEQEGNYNKPKSVSFGLVDTFQATRQVSNGKGSTGHGGGCRITFEESPLIGKPFKYRAPMTTNFIDQDGTSECDEAGNMGGAAYSCAWDGGWRNGFCMSCDCDDDEQCTRGYNNLITAHPEDRYYKYEIERIDVLMVHWSHGDWECGHYGVGDGDNHYFMTLNEEDAGGGPCGGATNCWGERWTCSGNYIDFAVIFNDAGQITHFRTSMHDGNNGGGAHYLPIFQLRESCSVLAQVADDDNDRAWTARVSEGSAFQVPALLYKYTQQFAPFGTVVAPAGDPTAWDYATHTGPLYVESRSDASFAHAGTPYSSPYNTVANGLLGQHIKYCTNNTGNWCDSAAAVTACTTGGGKCVGGRQCSWRWANDCATRLDEVNCHEGDDGTVGTDDDGYCVGIGVGFCSGNAEAYCAIDADCSYGGRNYGPCIMDGGTYGMKTATPTPDTNYAEAIRYSKRLFANAFNAWTWDIATCDRSNFTDLIRCTAGDDSTCEFRRCGAIGTCYGGAEDGEPCGGTCAAGDNASLSCATNADCPDSTCTPIPGGYTCTGGTCQTNHTMACAGAADCQHLACADNALQECFNRCDNNSGPRTGHVCTVNADCRSFIWPAGNCVTSDFDCRVYGCSTALGVCSNSSAYCQVTADCGGAPAVCNTGLCRAGANDGARCRIAADCPGGTCEATRIGCSDNVECTGVGVCSHDSTVLCQADTDCKNGSCSVTTSVECHVDTDCPGGETCAGATATCENERNWGSCAVVDTYGTCQSTTFGSCRTDDYGACTAPAGSMSYAENSGFINTWNTAYNTMAVCPYSTAQGKAVRPEYVQGLDVDYCGVPPIIHTILVGAGGSLEETDSITIPGGGVVQFTFSISADPEQSPITFVEVDWDDGTPHYVTTGRYESGTISLSHQYRIPGPHIPKIKVVDNWDWCGVLKDSGESCPGFGDCRFNVDLDDCDFEGGRDGLTSTGVTITVTQ
ncbi:MAG: dockerin type I domain-containing protein [Patescibacteria group bacterium]|nr:dockerin type I domain-containing protein [Patescibacteria group bacterium]MDD5715490.1 dockerin type I domain-containing protein [Patescibacteria group bacterium]